MLLQGSTLSRAIYCFGETIQGNKEMDEHIKDYLHKMQFFNMPHDNDVFLQETDLPLLKSTAQRFKQIQSTVGHGNFQLISFDEALKTAKSFSSIGSFTKEELEFLEIIFYRDATQYGFIGTKPSLNLTDTIEKSNAVRPTGSRQFIFDGAARDTYEKIRKDIGDKVVLTSGIRGIIKQFLLFLNKTLASNGNLSLASRSLAPPGYSFHSAGDFDVGQIHLGGANFTEKFTQTNVYKNLVERGYLNLRYEQGNLLGVRFEPWHIKLS